MKTSYSKIINSVNFQSISGETFKELLMNYIKDKDKTLSNKDFNNIYILETFQNKYIKEEAIKRLTQKTIIKSWSHYWLQK